MASRTALTLWVALAGAPLNAQQTDSAAVMTRTTLDGVFTKAQAASGATVFRMACGDCHAPSGFRDSTFLGAWRSVSVRVLFETIRTRMPLDNPGGLRRQEYADVLAYLFELNGLPPGDSALPADDAGLRRIRIATRPTTP